MTVRILLKSCATPAASWPIASIFWGLDELPLERLLGGNVEEGANDMGCAALVILEQALGIAEPHVGAVGAAKAILMGRSLAARQCRDDRVSDGLIVGMHILEPPRPARHIHAGMARHARHVLAHPLRFDTFGRDAQHVDHHVAGTEHVPQPQLCRLEFALRRLRFVISVSVPSWHWVPRSTPAARRALIETQMVAPSKRRIGTSKFRTSPSRATTACHASLSAGWT